MANAKNRAGEVNLDVAVVFGRAKLPLGALLKWSEGTIIELEDMGDATQVDVDGMTFEERAREPKNSRYPIVDVEINDQVFGQGEVITVGEQFGVRLLKILNQDKG